jgi:hypothetical protein
MVVGYSELLVLPRRPSPFVQGRTLHFWEFFSGAPQNNRRQLPIRDCQQKAAIGLVTRERCSFLLCVAVNAVENGLRQCRDYGWRCWYPLQRQGGCVAPVRF